MGGPEFSSQGGAASRGRMDKRFPNLMCPAKGRDAPAIFPARIFLASHKFFPVMIIEHFIC